jgi:hypothetical protein
METHMYHSIYLLDARSSVNVYQLVMSQRIHYPRISILLLSIQRTVSTSFGSTHETERILVVLPVLARSGFTSMSKFM